MVRRNRDRKMMRGEAEGATKTRCGPAHSGPSVRSVAAVVLVVAAATAGGTAVVAQETVLASGDAPVGARVVDARSTDGRPILHGTSVGSGEIRIDGTFDEAAWGRAEVATGFTQFQPDEGAAATERTEARILYGESAIYVAMRAHDSDADGIAGQLTRRDQQSHSDMLSVIIDSYFDRRTAFQFAVNPVGVKTDVYRFDDLDEDQGWDAVWDVSTSRDASGWSAEFRIPYSQLRFRSAEDQTWGINFVRTIARRQEMASWAPVRQSDGGIVSMSGELRGLRGISAPSRLEVLPYSLARLERAQGDEANPFYSRNATSGTAGADIKYGLTSDLTLDLTINPDFGQIEADPAQVNLTAFETFFPERRPFFVEGSSIFSFPIALGDGDEANESLFYPRRVGRPPQGWANPRGGYVDTPAQTTILGAWKLSGKTADGWSIGALHAMTAQETASIAPAGGLESSDVVEPLTNYGVFRLQKDLREGRSAVGVIATGIRRDGSVAEDLELRREAYSGGIDIRHRFLGDAWQLTGYVLGSHVVGSPAAIAHTQRSSARYYQRPDADHITYDPTRTSLTGAAAELSVRKFAGSPWRIGAGMQTRTPGFEVNDGGFQRDADYLVGWMWGGFERSTPQGPFLRWNVSLSSWTVRNYGWDHAGLGGSLNGNARFRNFWNAWAGVNHEESALSDGLLRGGPLFRTEAQTNYWAGVGTDSRKKVMARVTSFGSRRPESGSWSLGVAPNLRIRPSGRATFQVGAQVRRQVNDRQWVRRIGMEDGAHYLFGEMDQTTVGITARVDYAFTPNLSVQLYGQPFVSGARYSEFKRVTDPDAPAYGDRFEQVPTVPRGGRHLFELDGVPTSIGDPDFNFKQFRSNAVLRWEYHPGSVLYLVWSQGRNDWVGDGAFNFGSDLTDLFSAAADDVFMVKMSYWLSR